MEFEIVTRGALEYVRSRLLQDAPHCFSTRLGGVSAGSLASLNLGIHRGDQPERVLRNYEILGQAVGFAPEQTVFTRQTHTDIVARVGRENRGEGLFRPVEPERDGLVTDEPGVTLTIFTADCTPILFYDPVRQAVGAAHAGWRGTAAGIAARTVEAMTREFGSDPADIRAAIGPCISRCCSNLSCPAVQCINDIVLRLIDQNPIAWIFLLLLGRSVPLQNRFHLYRNNHPDFFHVCRSSFAFRGNDTRSQEQGAPPRRILPFPASRVYQTPDTFATARNWRGSALPSPGAGAKRHGISIPCRRQATLCFQLARRGRDG